MSSERVWYEVALETFCREAKKRASPATLAKLKAAGLSVDPPWPTGFDADRFAPLVKLVAADVFPRASPFEAQFQWGAGGAETYFSTFIGKALLPLIRAFGPHRYLGIGNTKRMTRHANSFQQVTAEKLGPNRYRCTIDDAEAGALTLGGLYASLGFLKLEGLKFQRVDAAPGSLAIEVEWS